MKPLLSLLLIVLLLPSVKPQPHQHKEQDYILLGAHRLEIYMPLIKGKTVGIVANHSTLINGTHLVDSLLRLGVRIGKIFSPEHGFRGHADAGELVHNHTDTLTGLPVISLYGSRRKPSPQDLQGVDIILFDLQDVGVRFYTYISTMHYVMEACAENGVPMVVLDRPNPNGFYVDGPVLDPRFKSFVGMHPVPLVHGMTIGEFAMMINGEGWLANGVKCELTVVPCANYTHSSKYILPIRPSPNLPNQTSIYLYPSLGLFEGTQISVGRGTDYPFQIFGHPKLPPTGFSFTPESRPGASKNPPHLGVKCHGIDLREYSHQYFISRASINLEWIAYAYQKFPRKDKFFNNFFNQLAGNDILRKQISQGLSPEQIRETWAEGIETFMGVRAKYLLYPDFTTSNNYGQE